jgi:dihydropteroate synthase
MNTNSLQLNLNNRLIDLTIPVVMGIVNVTPDSFFRESRLMTPKMVLQAVEKMIENGAQIVDVGGFSSRPGAEFISQDEEIKRVSEGVELILKKFPDTFISIDTFRSGVARYMVKNYQVAMINDISGGMMDDLMFETIADLQVAYVLMHMRGNSQNMQSKTQYEDVVADILRFLEKRVAQLHLLGVKDIIVDPGFGFAKTMDQNYLILSKLSCFKELNIPVLAGLSRKSMLYNLLNIEAEEALNATTAANILALLGGASILRVHDVKEAVQAIQIYQKYKEVQ